MARVGGSDAAEDIVQETLLGALKSRSSFAGQSTERTWLTGILKYKILDHLRKKLKETENPAQADLPVDQQQLFCPKGTWEGHWMQDFAPRDWGKDPQSLLEDKEFWSIFEQCLTGLPQHYRTVFTLYEMEDFSTDEICKELNITATNLWVIMHRSRRQLRYCLERNWMETVKNE